MNGPRQKEPMSVEFQNFGPITSGKITLKPLTILIGPNNSGKSYAAMIINSILRSRDLYLKEFARFFIIREDFDLAFETRLRQFWEQVENLEMGKTLEVDEATLREIAEAIFRQAYKKRLSEEISGSFACKLGELIQVGEDSFKLNISLNSYSVAVQYQKKGVLKVTEFQDLSKYPAIKIRKKLAPRRSINIEPQEKDNTLVIEITTPEEKDAPPSPIFQELFFDILLKNVPSSAHYLPAARSGILQAHRLLAGIIVDSVPYLVGQERIEIPSFSGVVANFISTLLNLPEGRKEKSKLYKLAEEFENKLIQGEVLIRSRGESRGPEIKYKFQNSQIPLYRSSSTVSELAPLFLYLKYIVRPGSMLIIEEPEAHLHPANQRILANLLVRLVRKGVYLTITTHSDYLLEQLNNFVMLSEVEPTERKKLHYDEEDYLKPDEIAAYVFNYDKDSGGHVITDVEVSEEGISPEEFSKIDEVLYEEIIKIRRVLDKER